MKTEKQNFSDVFRGYRKNQWLRKKCQNFVFLWHVFSRVSTESVFTRGIERRQTWYSGIFHAVNGMRWLYALNQFDIKNTGNKMTSTLLTYAFKVSLSKASQMICFASELIWFADNILYKMIKTNRFISCFVFEKCFGKFFFDQYHTIGVIHLVRAQIFRKIEISYPLIRAHARFRLMLLKLRDFRDFSPSFFCMYWLINANMLIFLTW